MENSNQFALIFDYAKVALRELYLHRIVVVIAAVLISFLVMGAGLMHKERYETSITLLADSQNIIKPLLSGQAAVTRIKDTTRAVREVIFSPRILSEVAKKIGLVKPDASRAEVEEKVNFLRSSLSVIGVGRSFIKITARGTDPATVYRTVTTVSDLFIKDASDTKQSESREAYQFIDKQVKGYKAQLQDAEEALKAFKAGNAGGSADVVKNRIASLRNKIEVIKLDIDEGNIRAKAIANELSKEKKFHSSEIKTDVFQQRLSAARDRLASLRLSFTDTHPDVIAMKHQIKEIEQTIRNANRSGASSSSRSTEEGLANLNPLYEELRSKLAEAKVEVESKKRRLAITQMLLEKEFELLKEAAAGQAQEAELKRDYNVTKSIYEDMLERKEKARLSMTLDIEGQGMTYKVQEPAVYPITPIGIRFIHFALIGPFIGFIVPLVLIVAYVVLDPRIRFSSILSGMDDVEVLASIPHVMTPIKKRIFSWDILFLGLFTIVTGCVYIGIMFAKARGYI